MEDTIKPGYSRVSEIISLYSGYDSVPRDILQKACERGSTVHSICESLISGFGCPSINPLYEGYIQSFNYWHKENGCYELSMPDRWYDDEFLVTGKADCIVKKDGKNILIDFKTSASESKAWKLQGGAYSWLCSSNENFTIDEIHFVKLDKKGNIPTVREYNLKESIELFEMALKLYLYVNK